MHAFEIREKEINEKTSFAEQFKKLKEKVTSKDFKNNLQGVFGFVQQNAFERNKKLILKFGDLSQHHRQ